MSEPLSPIKIQIPPKTCDTCKHGEKQANDSIICFGSPPVPVMLGQRPNRFGQGMDIQMENVRPILPKGMRACSLHVFDLTAANS